MARIEHLAFIAGGVIVPRLSDLALTTLFPDGEPGVETCLLAITLEGEVAQGTLALGDYCRRLLETTQTRWEATDLAQVIYEQLAPRRGISSLLDELASYVELRLVCDYPRDAWQLVSARHDLNQFFAPDAIFYTAERNAAPDYATFFEMLVAAGIIQRGRTLWVDYHSRRTSAGIRCGVDAAIFVDAERFRHDLELWDLLSVA